MVVNGASDHGGGGLLVALEECTRQIVANAATFGWDIPALEKMKLFFLDAPLSPEIVKAGDFDLACMLTMLEHKAKELSVESEHGKGTTFQLNLRAIVNGYVH